ncbi:MAG: type I methionyl aminopeptidase [Azoarcus sp.]|jgi:methionyl aminopeptidase|nr:type I methionyl aminopeptidase [Azoarcus sp.]
MSIIIKNPQEIEEMRLACRLAAEVLDFIGPYVKAGITTGELDRLCADYMRNVQHTTSATLHYQPPGYPPYPASVCISLNHQVCHGIPGPKTLKKDDILNIDVTVITPNGFFGDNSRMFIVGDGSILARRLCQVALECMWLGIATVRAGARLGDIGHAIQRHAEGNGFSVVREFCGHGIGRHFHEDPQVLHYGKPGSGPELRPGMIFTIEPMINAGQAAITELPDGWTIVTKDRKLSAQWEHTILVTETGAEVLTLSAACEPPPKLISGPLADSTRTTIETLPSAPPLP